jgi:putative endonuclease
MSKKDNKKLGNSGENTACLFLESKGYAVIEKNYKAYRKEIDIIAHKDGYIIFAEVKTRSSVKFGTPSESVNLQKQQHIIFAAKMFLLTNQRLYSNFQPRFDVIEIYRDKKAGKDYVRHIEGAFIT